MSETISKLIERLKELGDCRVGKDYYIRTVGTVSRFNLLHEIIPNDREEPFAIAMAVCPTNDPRTDSFTPEWLTFEYLCESANAIPALIAHIESQQKEIERLKERVEYYVEKEE